MADTTPPPNSSSGETAARIKTAREVKNDAVELMMDKPNVTAVGVGYKNRGRGGAQEIAIIVSVDKKLPERDLSPEDRIPRQVNGIPTDVVESGPFHAFAQTERLRPARPGISIGNVQITAGTYGCMVTRDGQRFVLSNNHVLADANKAPLGSVVVQPGTYDGGKNPADRIGVLQEFVPIAFDGTTPTPPPTGCGAQLARFFGIHVEPPKPFNEPGNNKVDCALCKPDDEALISPDILGIGVPRGVVLGTLGMAVTKSGRTTGLTNGEIEQIDVTSRVNFGGPIATFTGQLLAGAISQPGDSGSAVLDTDRNVIGLLFAGSNTSTLINPIQFVLEALKVEVVLAV
jgi:S1-C subfamily serine protease